MKKIQFFFLSLFLAGTSSHLHANEDLSTYLPSVAVVGAGGAGLTTAFLLENDFDVTLYESQSRVGGHANTCFIEVDGTTYTIDCGAEFTNSRQFSYFNKLLSMIGVQTHEFALTYTFHKTDNSNILILPPITNDKPDWDSLKLGEIAELVEFDYVLSAGQSIINNVDTSMTLDQFAESLDFVTSNFKNQFLYPFLGAAWGVSKEDVKQFSAYVLLTWIIKNKPTGVSPSMWNEVVGGMQHYANTLSNQLTNTTIHLSATITNITYDGKQYTITLSDGSSAKYDYVVLATNANQAAALLTNIPATQDVRDVLNSVEYYKTWIAVHGDKTFMPTNEKDWSVSNIAYDGTNAAMTVYKPWRCPPNTPIFRSWVSYEVDVPNSINVRIPQNVYGLYTYYHAKINQAYFDAQKAIALVQGNNNLFFAGVYTYDIDSHEDAIVSAINVAQKLAPTSERLVNLTATD
jgi:predicted NAD/FAD-binding protein